MEDQKRSNTKPNAHVRFNPLTGEHVLVCPNRMQRPWAGQESVPTLTPAVAHSSNNPLGPGNVRGNGERNPDYKSTYAFTNDFAALKPRKLFDQNQNEIQDKPIDSEKQDQFNFFQCKPAYGVCRVLCYNPRLDVRLSTLSTEKIVEVIEMWKQEFNALKQTYEHVQIFENKGEIMGCSNPHPHCQIWACDFMPNEVNKKDVQQKLYFEKHGRPMLIDYVKQELIAKERIVIENDHFVVLTPFWAVWPFEVMILPRKRNIRRIDELQEIEINALAECMKKLLVRYDRLFDIPFPYCMGWHGAPTGSRYLDDQNHWTLHAVYYPPLLNSATRKKFMVGFEMLALPQRDFTCELAADILRKTSDKELI